MSHQKLLSCIIAGILLAACSTTPVRDGSAGSTIKTTEDTRMQAAGEADWRPATHQVLKGDTLYSIAFYYGLDYHEIADLNGLKNPGLISIGQVLQLFSSRTPVSQNSVAASDSAPVVLTIKEQPKLVKYIYNDAAVAQIDSVQNGKATSLASSVTNVPSGVKVSVTPVAKVEPRVDAPVLNTDEDALQWTIPTSGKIIAQFSEAQNRKGIDIAGTLGQPIFASAPGKVVYSGSGLRGYGKLIIIKHNKTYLSAYAHNDKVLVKEGQNIKRGEKIAEMGNTDAEQIKLHFEVRRLGKPVDPAKYLPKS
ncbi:MAG: peptidoglycan DD-metalloendopeptidase family protein [Sideroxydans sp.]|nr:peptidoglycan DD-metalloendopeptidase family protein [Sideroxydans sp.]